jgi:hypothetical protein
LPTLPGQFGPVGLGLPIFVQAFTEDATFLRVASQTVAVEIEPLPFVPGFLVDEAATRLPAGYSTLGADWVEPVDIDLDGDQDLIISVIDDVRIWINDGNGHFTDESATRISWLGGELSTIAVADIDGNGAPDLLTGGGFDDFISLPDQLWLNDGTGHFTVDTSFPEGMGITARFEIADLDGDQRLDVVVANGVENHLVAPGGKDQVYYNVSPGFWFVDPGFAGASWNDELTPTLSIKAGDLDGDGDMDLFVGKADTQALDGIQGQPNILLENQGAVFVDVSATNILPLSRSDNTQDLIMVDIDGDFDLDILVSNSVLTVFTAESNDVLINQGGLQGGTEGVFADDPASFLETNSTADGIRLTMHAEDIDLDGDKDLLISVHDLFTGADQALFMNQGGAQGGIEGDFTREFWFDPPFSGVAGIGDFISRDAAVFDADGDGDREIIILANGVITGDPVDEATVRFLINTQL